MEQFYYRGKGKSILTGPLSRDEVEKYLNQERPWEGTFFSISPISTAEVVVSTTKIKVA